MKDSSWDPDTVQGSVWANKSDLAVRLLYYKRENAESLDFLLVLGHVTAEIVALVKHSTNMIFVIWELNCFL